MRSEKAADVAPVEAVSACGKIPTRSVELGDRRSECSMTVRSLRRLAGGPAAEGGEEPVVAAAVPDSGAPNFEGRN